MKSRAYRPIMLFLVALCCGGISQAQDPETGLYRSFFGEESSSWTGVTEYYDLIENQWMRTDGDTMFSGMVYKKIKSRTGNFLLREDITCGKLWCRYMDEDSDFLVADLSLSLNDTVSLPNKYRGYFVHQMSYRVIDTGSTEQGRIVILEALFGPRSTIKFIEGVGGTNLFDCLKYDAFTSQVMCCHRDGELVFHEAYKDYPEEDCKVLWNGGGVGVAREKVSVIIYPNPCEDWLNVGYDGVCEVTVTDLYGRVAMSVVVDNGRMDVSGLKKGCYTVRIEANGKSYVKKIVKV